MFERRTVWALLLGLYVCILIWQIKVQEEPLLKTADIGLDRWSENRGRRQQQQQQQEQQQPESESENLQQQQKQLQDTKKAFWNLVNWNAQHVVGGKHLLAERLQSNESILSIMDAEREREREIDENNNLSKNNKRFNHMQDDVGRMYKNINENMKTQKFLPSNDFSQLIDIHNFMYLMTQPACDDTVEALILVHSAPHNSAKRMLIRETWGSFATLSTSTSTASTSPLRLIFLLGAVTDPSLQYELRMENANYEDMIQGSFIDQYRNMTYKHIMAFKWFLYNCANAQILIKVDDDIFLNTPLLLQYSKRQMQQQQQQQQQKQQQQLHNETTISGTAVPHGNSTVIANDTAETQRNEASAISSSISSNSIINKNKRNYIIDDHGHSHSHTHFHSQPQSQSQSQSHFEASNILFNHPKNLLFCHEHRNVMVKRSYRSKWRVSFKEYPGRYYPSYCAGYAIIYSSDVVLRLYMAAQRHKYFWIDDVYTTGILAQNIGQWITTSMRYIMFSDVCDNLLAGKTDLSEVEFLFAWHLISPQQIQALWQLHLNIGNVAINENSTVIR